MHLFPLINLTITNYLNRLFQINIEWNANDAESFIHDCEVAIGTKELVSEDIVPFTSTRGQTKFIDNANGLLQDVTFYIHIKAFNLAQLFTTKVNIN